MTSVTRQIPHSGSLHAMQVPDSVTMVPQHPGGVKAFVAAQNMLTELNHQRSNGVLPMQGKPRNGVSVSNGNTPPPPPTRTTSAQSAKVPYKEDVVLKQSLSPSRTGVRAGSADRAGSVDRMTKEGSMERGILTSASGDVVFGGEEYSRQRSNTDSSKKQRPKNHFNTVQWRGDVRFNPYTGATAQSMHSKFSASQPHLNLEEQEGFVMPNDRIKKSMFEHGSSYDNEQGEGIGEDYGSGYRPTLMKIGHGTIQKHAVAVTTPVAPSKPPVPPKMNRYGSDPNLLESQLDRAGMTRANVPGGGIQMEKSGVEDQSPTKREGRHSVSGPVGADATTDIARAYREHLLEKIEKDSRKRYHTSSVSPSHSASSAGSEMAARGGQGLSSKLRNMTPSQLQAMEVPVPDKAYYPRILPPPADSKQDQSAEALHNGVQPHNPFLLHSSDPVTRYDVPDTGHDSFSYSTLPRKKPDTNHGQVANMAFKDRTQSVNELHSQQNSQSYAVPSQKEAWDHTSDELTRSLGSVQRSSQAQLLASMPNYLYSKSQEAPVPGGTYYWRNGPTGDRYYSDSTTSTSISGSQSSTQASSSSNSQGHSHQFDLDTAGNQAASTNWRVHQSTLLTQQRPPVPKHGNHFMGFQKNGTTNGAALWNGSGSKPSVMPKPPVARRNGSSLTPPPTAHERSTSDPSHKYGQPGASGGHQSSASINSASSLTLTPSPAAMWGASGGHQSSASTNSSTLTPSPAAMFDSPDSRHGPSPLQSSGGRPKHHLPGQQMTNLLDIREEEERGKERVRGMPRPKFSDYVSLNSTLFPKRVRLVRDFSSSCAEVAMSQGEEFDLHFVRSIKSVIMQDTSDVNYTVPLASVAKFSIIYNPFSVEKVAMQGFHFKSAGVLMDLKNPPHVVAATQRFDGGRAESSVEDGEILVLNGIKNVFHGRLLKVFSVKHHTTKYIDEQCYGNFSTNPANIRMSLAEIYETSIPLPQRAQFYPTTSILSSVQASFQSGPVLLKRFTMMKSVIATTTTTSSGFIPVPKSPAVSLSLDLEIDVQEVPVPETRMRKKTQLLLESFEKTSFIPYIDMPTTASYMAQCALLLNLDPKLENYDSEILTPSSFTSPKRHKYAATKWNQAANTQSSDSVSSTSNTDHDRRIKALEGKYTTLESKVLEACDNLVKVTQKVDQIHGYLSKAQNAMNKHKRQLRESEERNSRKSSGSTTSVRHHSSADHTPVGMANYKDSASISTSSKESSLDRPDSRLSSKFSESDSVDGGNSDQRDDVFIARPASASKPPILPKPKDITTKMLKRADSNPKVTEAKRKLSLSESPSQQGTITAINSHVTNVKRKFSQGEAPVSVVNAGSSRVAEAKRKLSVSKDSQQSAARKWHPNPTPVSAKEPPPAVKAPIDPVDLKHYLLDSSSPKHKTAMLSNERASSTTEKLPADTSTLETDFDNIEAITDDLTDWCMQVEDELTQLYNDSILSASPKHTLL